MSIRKYTKSAISVDQQIEQLKAQGLLIPDDAGHILSTVSLHRLSAYFHPYQENDTKIFNFGASLQHVWELYAFDRELRLLILDAIERIEIALRTALTNVMAVKYSPWWYLSDEVFKTNWSSRSTRYEKNPKESLLTEIQQICKNRKHNEEINQYFDKYDEPLYPPSWIIIEFLSFGQCTSLFRYIRSPQDKAAISAIFNFHHKIFESILEPLRYTRNLCAHHARLWDRWFVYKPRFIEELSAANCKPGTLKEQLMLLYLLNNSISSKSTWLLRLRALFEKHRDLPINLQWMGFQKDSQNDPFWKL